MSPRSAAHALSMLRPRIAVPIHWGTLYVPGSAYAGKQATTPGSSAPESAPRSSFRLAAESAPDVEVRLLEPGQSLGFWDRRPTPSAVTAEPRDGAQGSAGRRGRLPAPRHGPTIFCPRSRPR